MAKMLPALLKLQSIELQLVEVRTQLRVQGDAVNAQQSRIAQFQEDYQKLHEELVARQKEAAAFELELRSKEEGVVKLRGVLNTTKTNKEYAAVLTQINTIKADNSKLEDQALKAMQECDQVRAQAEEVKAKTAEAERALEGIQRSSTEEVARLEGILEALQKRRAEAVQHVPSDPLAVFERIASTRNGEAMAIIEIHGRKPPHEYSCGGCFMSVTAEHANALGTRDELRFCDNCGRILYLAEQAPAQKA